MPDAHQTSTRNSTHGHLAHALERRLLLAAADLDGRFDGNGLLATDFPAFSHWVDAVVALPGGKYLAGAESRGAYTVARFNADGSYDRSFGGGDGKVSGYGGGLGGMAVAPDGKILVPGRDFGVTRYNADGTLDAAFARGGADGNGVFTLGWDDHNGDVALSVAVRPDGKILVAGSVNLGFPIESILDLALVRLNPDGSPDSSFGGGDGVLLSGERGVEGVDARAGALLVLPSSQVLLCGRVGDDAGVFRFNDDFSPDATFGGGDGLAEGVGFGRLDLGTDGKIIITGEAENPDASTELSITRLTPDGRPDRGFGGGDGVAAASFGGAHARFLDAAATAGGAIVAAGEVGGRFAAVRLTAAGALDARFGRGGLATGPAGSAVAVASAADGGAVIAGLSGDPSSAESSVGMFKVTARGTPDASFGGDGVVLTRLPSPAAARAVVVQPDGKVVAAGHAGDLMAMARYNPDGSLDKRFGPGGFDGGGRVTVPTAPAATALALLPGGKLLTAGDNGLHRFRSDGSLDPDFVGGGLPLAGVRPSIAMLPGGKVVAAATYEEGLYFPQPWGIVLARYNPDGTFDAGFGDDGFVSTDPDTFQPISVDSATGVAVTPDGGIVVTATRSYYGGFAVARFGPTGAVDRSFGTGGIVTVDAVPGSSGESADAVAVLPGGGMVVAGHDGGRAVLVQLRADGSPDQSFGGGDGVVVGPAGAFSDVLVAGDGKLLAAGEASGDFFVARYLPDGTADSTFDRAAKGAVRVNFGPSDAAGGLALAPDGGIVAAGSAAGAGSWKFAVARLKGDPTRWPATYEAESALISGARASADHAGYSGTGFVDYLNQSGDSVQFTIAVPSGGRYELDFRYANGGTSSRPLDLSIDGQLLGGRISFSLTGSWRTWETATQSVLLTAGVHTVRLTAAGRSGPNLDTLAVRPAGAGYASGLADWVVAEGPESVREG